MYKKVKNSARFVGEVVAKYPTSAVTILTIKTVLGENKYSFPKVICFERVKPQADKIEVGDHVLVDCAIQSNKRDESIKNQSMRTIAANHIIKVDPNGERYRPTNAFRFFCRVLSTNKINDHVVLARIFFFTNRAHYMTVVFKSDDTDKIDEFCNIETNQPVILNGSVETKRFRRKDGELKYTEDCVVRSFAKVRIRKDTKSEKESDSEK